MSQPDAFHIPAGARVEWRQANRKVQGEVVCYRAIGQRQVLTVRRSDGELVSLMAEKAKALSRHPIGRLGKPEDIAWMVLYLASDEAGFVTGAEMVVDGGYLMV